MSDNPQSKGHFDPVHDAHAIEQVVFVLQTDSPLEDQTFLEAREAADTFRSELPGRGDFQGMGLVFGVVGVGVPPAPIVGTAFSRTNPAGMVESELRVERSSLTFRTTLYTRWDTVWAQARKYFDVLVPKYATKPRIAGISLNFVDRFVWTGKTSECRPDLLLRRASKYVAPHVYELTDLWHSHTGAFIRADSQTKRLLNVNIDYVDGDASAKTRNVVVTTVLNDMFNQPDYETSEFKQDAAMQVFEEHMQELHMFGKKVFGNIINDEMKKRIALVD